MTDGSPRPLTARVAAIVPAAGRGERLGAGGPKAFVTVAGTPLVVHAVRSLVGAQTVDLVVVAAPPEAVATTKELLAAHALSEVLVVAGGVTRQESVARALEVLPPDVALVLVHDAARSLAPSQLADAVVAALRAGADAVVPGVPVADTVKVVDALEVVTGTPDRAALRAVQTPQGFVRTTLEAAHAAGGDEATDDAGLVERLGLSVLVVPGSEEAFKITRPLDLVVAEAVLARRASA